MLLNTTFGSRVSFKFPAISDEFRLPPKYRNTASGESHQSVAQRSANIVVKVFDAKTFAERHGKPTISHVEVTKDQPRPLHENPVQNSSESKQPVSLAKAPNKRGPKFLPKPEACSNCSSTHSRYWRPNPQDRTAKVCHTCYERIRRAQPKVGCSTCPRTANTHRWHSNPKDTTAKICDACYQGILRAQAKTRPHHRNTSKKKSHRNPNSDTQKISKICLPVMDDLQKKHTAIPSSLANPLPRVPSNTLKDLVTSPDEHFPSDQENTYPSNLQSPAIDNEMDYYGEILPLSPPPPAEEWDPSVCFNDI